MKLNEMKQRQKTDCLEMIGRSLRGLMPFLDNAKKCTEDFNSRPSIKTGYYMEHARDEAKSEIQNASDLMMQQWVENYSDEISLEDFFTMVCDQMRELCKKENYGEFWIGKVGYKTRA